MHIQTAVKTGNENKCKIDHFGGKVGNRNLHWSLVSCAANIV